MKNKILFNSIVLCVFLIANWIIDITTWIHDDIYSSNGFMRIDVYNVNIVYHILWYIVIIIGVSYIIKDMMKK